MDANGWASEPGREPRRPKPARVLITDPREAYEAMLESGHSPQEAAEVARQAESNARHEQLVEEEEDRMVRRRHRESRLWWGLSSEDLG
jgi:hypothetical protein